LLKAHPLQGRMGQGVLLPRLTPAIVDPFPNGHSAMQKVFQEWQQVQHGYRLNLSPLQ
jgi:hypothetical protein